MGHLTRAINDLECAVQDCADVLSAAVARGRGDAGARVVAAALYSMTEVGQSLHDPVVTFARARSLARKKDKGEP